MSEYKRKSAHEKIMELRKFYDIPEEEIDPEEEEQFEREREIRRQRMDLAVTEEAYAQMFNRDPWTDNWLGPGPEPDDPYYGFPGHESKESGKKEKSKERKLFNAKYSKDWKKKYTPKIPTVHLPAELPESKKVKKLRKKRKSYEEKTLWHEKCNVAYYWLEKVLKPEFAWEYYTKYAGNLEGLVEDAYTTCIEWAQYMTYDEPKTLSYEEMVTWLINEEEDGKDVVLNVDGMKFKPIEVAHRHQREYIADPYEDPFPSIPDEYWAEFEKWCDDHPLKKYKKKAEKYGPNVVSPAGLRRIKFLKKLNKRNKGFRKNMMLHDPITGSSFVSKKKMEAHIQKQLKKYDNRRREFIHMLDGLVAKGQISEDMANDMMGDTKLVRQRILKRQREQYERIKFTQKQADKYNKHQKAKYEARKKWCKEHGADIGDYAFTIMADGEELKFTKKTDKKTGRSLYGFHDATSSSYGENFEDTFYPMAEPRYIEPPKPPIDLTKDPSYNEIPDY